MAFDPKTVFGLCNVLNRHATSIHLKILFEESSQYQVEQWAKRMDLVYRESLTNWRLILREPVTAIENLKLIEKLSSELITKLYNVEPAMQKQLSKGLRKGGFVKFRTVIREEFEALKEPLNEVNRLFDTGLYLAVLPESIAAVDSVIDVWKSSKKNNKTPKTIKSNVALRNFMADCFEIFQIEADPEKIYMEWYKLNYG